MQRVSEEGELEPGPSEWSATSYHSAASNFATIEDLNNSLSPNSMRHSSSTGASSHEFALLCIPHTSDQSSRF